MKRKTFRDFGICLFMITAVYILVPLVLDGYRYRIHFRTIVSFILLTLWVGFGMYGAVRAASNATRKSNRRYRTALAMTGGTIAILALALCHFLGMITFIIRADSITEKESFDNGVMLLSNSFISDEASYDLYVMKAGPIFYRKLTTDEEAAYGITQPQWPVRKHFAHPGEAKKDMEPAAPAQEDADTIMRRDELTAIYQFLVNSGKAPFDGDAPMIFKADAKGVIYAAILESDVQYRLVYDRRSRNGECDLFVLYKMPVNEASIAKASMINTYAVNIETKAIAASGKTDWSDGGTEEYHQFAGEW